MFCLFSGHWRGKEIFYRSIAVVSLYLRFGEINVCAALAGEKIDYYS